MWKQTKNPVQAQQKKEMDKPTGFALLSSLCVLFFRPCTVTEWIIIFEYFYCLLLYLSLPGNKSPLLSDKNSISDILQLMFPVPGLIRIVKEYSGWNLIYSKVHPIDPPVPPQKKHSSIGIWVIGVYVAYFGLAFQNFQDSRNRVEFKLNLSVSQLATHARNSALTRLAKIQLEQLPAKPEIFALYEAPFWLVRKGASADIIEETKMVIASERGKYSPITRQQQTLEQEIELLKLSRIERMELDITSSSFGRALLGYDPEREKLSKKLVARHKKEKALSELYSAGYFETKGLSNIDLNGVDLSGANLNDAIMWGTHMDHAILTGADLSGSLLLLAKLNGAHLKKADLSSANLGVAELKKVDMQGAILIGTRFRNSNLSGANLYEAMINDALFEDAKLDGAIWVNGMKCEKGSIGRCIIQVGVGTLDEMERITAPSILGMTEFQEGPTEFD